MDEDYGEFVSGLLLYLFAGTALAFFMRWGGGWQDWAKAVIPVLAIILAIAATVLWINWFGPRLARIVGDFVTNSNTRLLEMREWEQMSKDKLAVIERYSGHILVHPGDHGPSLELEVNNGERIPYSFICGEWLRYNSERFLPAIGTWGEGSQYRLWAQLLTEHFIGAGYARPPRGNQPATWIDYRVAMEHHMLLDSEPESEEEAQA